MQGYIRRLENPPVSSKAAFAEQDNRAAQQDDIRTDATGVIVEPSAAERLAEHTGHDEYLLADKIADGLAAGARGVQLTSGERLIIASVIRNHRQS